MCRASSSYPLLPKAAGSGARNTSGCVRVAGQGSAAARVRTKDIEVLAGSCGCRCCSSCLLSLPRLFSVEVARYRTKGVQPERRKLARRAESFLKGNAVVVLRRSFHICGWRFPGFSEVNAGSARCRQIRFTSDLSNRLAAHWLLLLPPANVASRRPALKLPHVRESSCSLSQITAL